MEKDWTISDIRNILPVDFKIMGNDSNTFSNIKTIESADTNSLGWISPSRTDKQKLVETTQASVIICDQSIIISNDLKKTKCFVIVDNPKLAFLRIVNQLFSPEKPVGVHPTAFISTKARVHEKSFIGAFTYVGDCTIGEGSVIHGHCYLYDNVYIGKDVMIHSGTIIGADGFGYSKNDKGELERFPHIGGVVIEDHVEIGANTCIDKGSLGNTLIKRGAKIDNLVHIAHNVVIGENAVVIALAMIGGSTKIGDNSWIAPSAILRDAITIGNNATVGMGALVTKDVPDNDTWAGNPARPMAEFLEIQKKLKKL